MRSKVAQFKNARLGQEYLSRSWTLPPRKIPAYGDMHVPPKPKVKSSAYSLYNVDVYYKRIATPSIDRLTN